MLTITDISPSLVVKMTPREGSLRVGRYIKRLNAKPHNPPFVLIEIEWNPEAISVPNYDSIESFLKSAAKQHDKEVAASTHQWNYKTYDTLATAKALSSRHNFSQCPGKPPRKDLLQELVDTVAAICVKAGICQWTADKSFMALATSHEETEDKGVYMLAGLLDAMPIETPAASAGHKRKSDFEEDEEDDSDYQQFRRSKIIATTSTCNSSQLGDTPFF